MASRLSLLIAEDDPTLRLVLRAALEKSRGRDVLEAEDGHEALRIIDEASPDVILLDLLLPGASGFEILEELHSRSNDTRRRKIVVLSGLGGPTMASTLAQLGVDSFLPKPFRIEELQRRISWAFRQLASETAGNA